MRPFVILLSIIIISSCSFFKKERNLKDDKGKLIAKVKDSYLYEKDLKGIYTSKISKQDSILLRQHFVNSWVKEQLFYYKALNNLTDDEKNKDEELKEYYQSLIKYEYEKKLIDQRLDKSINDSEITKYYNENKDIFRVTRCIVRLIFVQLPQKTPDIKKVEKWFNSTTQKDKDFLYQYCIVNSYKYSLDVDKWYYFDDINKTIPIEVLDCSYLKTNVTFRLTDSAYVYFVNFKESKHEGTLSPLEFEKEKIKNIILHKRSINLINKAEDAIFNEGLEKNYFNIYE